MKYSKKIIDIVQVNKEDIINHLTGIYEKALKVRDYDKEKKKLEEKIFEIKTKKDKLLDLCMKNLISENEFSERNEILNVDLDKCYNKIQDIELEKVKSENTISNINKIKKVVSNEIDSDDSFKEKVQLLVEKVIIHKINGDRNNIRLEIKLNLFLKNINVFNGKIDFDEILLFCSHEENNDCNYRYRILWVFYIFKFRRKNEIRRYDIWSYDAKWE